MSSEAREIPPGAELAAAKQLHAWRKGLVLVEGRPVKFAEEREHYIQEASAVLRVAFSFLASSPEGRAYMKALLEDHE